MKKTIDEHLYDFLCENAKDGDLQVYEDGRWIDCDENSVVKKDETKSIS